MAEKLVRVRFIKPHGVYNAGEIAGLVPAVAKRLCESRFPVAVVVTDDAKALEQADLEKALRALPEKVQQALGQRIAEEVQATRKPLLAEIEKLTAEAKPLAQQLADAAAEIEKLKARLAEVEAAKAKGAKK